MTGAQSAWLRDPTGQPLIFLGEWIASAVVAVGIVGVEMLRRSRRHHSGLADAMIYNAVEHFLPAGAAGAFLALVFFRFAPEDLWMLPGLWQVLVSIGIFASVRSLPRPVALAGAWYFIAGLGVLMLSSRSHSMSAWTMGAPFIVGQLLMAAIIHLASGDTDAQA